MLSILKETIIDVVHLRYASVDAVKLVTLPLYEKFSHYLSIY